MKRIIATFFLLASVGSANATLLLSDTTNTTSSGQFDSEIFGTAGFENYKIITLDVHAVGDYGDGSFDPNENINFNIDGTDLGSYSFNTAGVTATQVGVVSFDWDLVFSISISEPMWQSFIADSFINITWTNSANVGFRSDNPTHFVSYEINAIPEPASIALLGLGLVGLGFSRKMKAS